MGPKTKKVKKAKKLRQQPSCSNQVHQGTENVREQNTKAQEKPKTIRLYPASISPTTP